MLTLYQFPPIWGLPNASTFCCKVETYLRMADIPYEICSMRDPRKAPKGKLPFIKIDGQTIPDSEFIIDHLINKYGDSLDKNLTETQKAFSLLLENIFAERLYWIMCYLRWQDEKGWAKVKKPFFGHLSGLAGFLVPIIVRQQMKKTLYRQGIGRHHPEEVCHLGYKTLDALALVLGENKYFQGSELTRVDATAFAFLANIAWLPFDDPLKIYLQNQKNLLTYCDKIWSAFYPELAKPFKII